LNGGGFRNLSITFTGIITGSVSVYGDVTLAPIGGSATGFSPTFLATATISAAGRTIGSTTVNAPGATVTTSSPLTLGVTNTFTLTAGTLSLGGTLSTGIFSSTNTNTRAIAFGANSIALASTTAGTTVLNMATATGFTFTGDGGFTRNMAATATINFGATAGGSVANAPNLTVNAGAATLTIISNSYFRNAVFTSSTSTVTGTYNACGNLTLGSGTYSFVIPTFLASGLITTSGRQLGSTTINGSGITVTTNGAVTIGGTTTLTAGTFNAANFNVTTGSFSSSNSNTRTLNMGSGTWTISGSGATAWNTATTTGLTVAPSTSTITMTSSSAKTFDGGGLTYYNLRQGGSGALTIQGNNTFNDITNTVQPNTVTFTAGTTQTVSNFSLSGTNASNRITINSSSPGSQFTLSKASGTVNASFLSIRDSNATGGATWNALNSLNVSNNTGWIFPGGNMFLMFM
jgi:hypothetical protein